MISLKGIGKTYGAVRALVDVTYAFRAGTIGVVTGGNGSGKSTLLAIVGTLARPTSGEIDYGAIGPTRRDVRRTLGWVGHESLCYPDLTGVENIELAAKLQGCDPQSAVARARERFELGSFATRSVRTYSRGQRQRVAIARALVHDPMLILFDEPTTGLDEQAKVRLARVVAEEAGRGAVVVVVTHEPDFARGAGRQVLELDRGRIRDNALGEAEHRGIAG
jgi:heme exporter protein A